MTKSLATINEPQTLPINGRPPPLSPTMRSGVDRLLAATSPEGDGVYSIPEAEAPSEFQRHALMSRTSELNRAIAPADRARLMRAVGLFAGAMPAPLTDNSDPEATLEAYRVALCTLPLWVVEDACAAALRGKIGNSGGRFRPSPGEMYQYGEKALAAIAREKVEIDRVLNARIELPRLSAEERKAAVARVREMIAPIRGAPSLNEQALTKAGREMTNLEVEQAATDRRDLTRRQTEALGTLDQLAEKYSVPCTLSAAALNGVRAGPREDG